MIDSTSVQHQIPKHLYRKIFSQISEGLLLVDDQLKIINVNLSAAELLNQETEQIINKQLSKVVTTIDTQKLSQFISDFFKSKQQNVHLGVHKPPDQLTHLEINKHLNLSPGIHLLRIRNVTQIHAHSQRQNKFVAIAGHELKNPVAIIKAYSQLLQKRLQDKTTKSNLNYLKKIESKSNLLNKLISDIIDEIKAGSNELTFKNRKTNIDKLVTSVVSDVKKLNPKRQIKVKGKTQSVIKLDKARITQVLTNLISNAIKYSPKDTEIIVSLKNNKNSVIVSVQDFGKGIVKSEQKKIFHPFFRSQSKNKSKTTGLGLGLYLTKRIIDHYQGKIWFESKYNQGTIFYISIPFSRKT